MKKASLVLIAPVIYVVYFVIEVLKSFRRAYRRLRHTFFMPPKEPWHNSSRRNGYPKFVGGGKYKRHRRGHRGGKKHHGPHH